MNHPSDPLPTPQVFHGQRVPWLVLGRGWKPILVVLVITGLATTFALSSSLPAVGNEEVLGRYGVRVLAVFIAAVILWVSEATPLVVTGIGVFVALVLCGGIDRPDPTLTPGVPDFSPQMVSNWFGDRVVFFLLGIFLVAGAITCTHVVDHAALRLLKIIGTSPRRLRQGVFWVTFLASWFMAEHAVTAMLFPVVARIRDALGKPRGSSTYIAGLFHALAWGATIGGIVTYLGGARIALAMGIAQKQGLATPSFLELMGYSLPIAIPFGIAAAIILEFAFPVDIATVAPAREALEERRRELGRFGVRQQLVTLILALTVAMWAWTGVRYLAPVALGSAALLMGSGLVRWRDLQHHVPWDLLLMEGGALALCAALEATGAAKWGAHQAFGVLGHSPLVIITVVTLAAILLTEMFSNPAVVTLLVPLLIASAPALGFADDPLLLVMAVALPCGLSFMLPLGSPPLAIAFSSGEYKVAKVLAWGLLLDLLAVPIIVAAYWFFWR